MAEWHNVRLDKLSLRARQALENKLAASKIAAEANREWQRVINEDFGPLPKGKRFAVNLNLKWQQLGLKIVDEDEAQPTKPQAKAKQSLEEWKAQQLANGDSL